MAEALTNPLQTRRDFLEIFAVTAGAAGVMAAAWPFIDSMNPATDTLAMLTTDVDLANIAEGQAITVSWRGKPVFVRHRTAAEIAAAQGVDLKELRDPQTDAARVKQAEWLVVLGVCTHLACIPGGQKATEPKGEFGGWFCPCHGSQYDTSGRIRKGPAPRNLEVPMKENHKDFNYAFLTDDSVRIG